MSDLELLKQYLLSDDISQYEKQIFNIIPELKYSNGFDQKSPWHKYDVWHHIVTAVNNCDKNFEDRLTLLLHDVGKPFSFQDDGDIRHFHHHADVSAIMAHQILIRLDIDKNTNKKITSLIMNHSTRIDLTKVNSNNIDYYLKLIKIQKCDGSAYEEQHSFKILQTLEEQEEVLNNMFENKIR